ncbi:MAG TPA: GAF domain-containing sensor histidine kinase [Bryobacteraceae bacterium]|nr:GAF domain-containing sensor histidine kinase [Bryobacteraceae bacterium]
MAKTTQPTVLAAAADVLSDQLRVKLEEIANRLRPRASQIEKRFVEALQSGKDRLPPLDDRQAAALRAITPGAALRTVGEGRPIGEFFEQVEYNGRRLAKMHLPPSSIVAALEQYDHLLAGVLENLIPQQRENLRWVREQLLFCVILTLNNAFYQVREAETKTFYDLFRVELESRTLGDLLSRFLSTLSDFCNASRARLYLLNEETSVWTLGASFNRLKTKEKKTYAGTPWRAGNTPALRLELSESRCLIGKTASCAPDPAWSRRGVTLWSLPLTSGADTWGVLQFSFDKDFEWLPRERELLTAAAERCWMAIEKARLVEGLAAREEQVRQLAEHMLHVEEAERRRISRELHDEAGQSMLCIRLQMEMLETSLPESMAEQRQKLREVRNTTEHTILEIRRLIAALSPAVLEQLGLGAALRQLVNRFLQVSKAQVRLSLHRLGPLPKKTEMIVYRLVQECFNNIAKHSRAKTVNLSVTTVDGYLKLVVDDNGIGFDVEEALARRDSFGLSGMRERVALLGGTFQIESNPVTPAKRLQSASADRAGKTLPVRKSARGRGTKIVIALPLPKEAVLQGAMSAERGTTVRRIRAR